MTIPQPIGTFLPCENLWMLRERWYMDTPFGRMMVLPGFITDGASIPFWLRWLVGPKYSPKTFAAAFAHDAGYTSRKLKRNQADALFRDMLAQLIQINHSPFHVVMLIRAIGKWAKVYSYYFAVRLVGWFPYYFWRDKRIVAVAKESVFIFNPKGKQ